jgi:hypothetical protein
MNNQLFHSIKSFVVEWSPAIIIMIAIFLFSNTPSNSLPKFGIWDLTIKKGSHMLGYSMLSLSFVRGLKEKKPDKLLIAFGLSFLYAMSDEFHQSFTPGRIPSIIDVGVDLFGSVIAFLIYYRSGTLQKIVHYFG